MKISLTERRTLGALLLLSLALNLFLAGVIGGRLMQPHGPERGFESTLQRLPEEQRASVREHLRAAAPEMRTHRRAMRAIHRRLLEALASTEPDRALLEEELAAIRRHAGAMQEALHRSFLDAVLDMPPEARGVILEAMLRRTQGMPAPFGPPERRPPPPPPIPS
jgi:uncharacterized membrane protein